MPRTEYTIVVTTESGSKRPAPMLNHNALSRLFRGDLLFLGVQCFQIVGERGVVSMRRNQR